MAFITRLQRLGVRDAKKGNGGGGEKLLKAKGKQRQMPEDTVSVRKGVLFRAAGCPRVGKE